MHLEVVTHCWRYEGYLAHQLASLIRNQPTRHELTVTVFTGETEAAMLTSLCVPSTVRWWIQEPRNLCNRAIGRNMAAKATRADWVWFADCDYVVGRRWLDRVCDVLMQLEPRIVIAYPRTVARCGGPHGRYLAAEAVALARAGALTSLKFVAGDDFVSERCCRSSGGTMFVRGAVCRQRGYLDGNGAALAPVDTDQWQPPIQDPYFRQDVLKGSREATFKVRGLYRLGN